MKIKRSVLENIVREELAAHIRSLLEGPKGKEDAAVVDADQEKKQKKEDEKSAGSSSKDVEKDAQTEPKGDQGAKELPVPDDKEADKDLEKDVAGEDAEDVTGGKIADQIAGKTVQSVTMEPKSKVLPGAQEIVITFREIPDPLKILVTKTGQVKFLFKGLHNEL